ncbi:MAG TPA: hypothetical protein VEY30_09320, partial [Myxococcaceae bacterium]|nr:hypothetical protein [Myxococcaceae bacterium]
VALVIYFAPFAISIAGFAVAFRLGFEFRGVGGNLGLLAAAWAATKVIQPLRILATLALAPWLGRRWKERRAQV